MKIVPKYQQLRAERYGNRYIIYLGKILITALDKEAFDKLFDAYPEENSANEETSKEELINALKASILDDDSKKDIIKIMAALIKAGLTKSEICHLCNFSYKDAKKLYDEAMANIFTTNFFGGNPIDELDNIIKSIKVDG